MLLCLFTGGVSGHHFYLGRTGLGIAYLVFCWTFIPALIAVVELFLRAGRVRSYNAEVAAEIATKLKALLGNSPGFRPYAGPALPGGKLRPGPEGAAALLAAGSTQPKGGALKAAALGAAGGALAGAAAVRAADVMEDAQSAEVGEVAEAAESAGEEGEGVASTLASLLGDE